jgi:HK97 family phage portal protein
MTKNTSWDDVQRRAAVEGSPILTNWRAERQAARLSNQTQYSPEVMEAFGIAPSGQAVSATSAMRVSAVASCVSKIAGAIISMPIHEYALDGGEIPSRLPRSDLWYLLNEQPSPQFTAASMWEGASMAQLLRGDAFGLLRWRMNGTLREILPLPWGSVSPIRTPGEGVRYYVNLPSHGISTWFDPADILHFPGLGFDDATMRSMSVIQFGARSAIGNALAMDEYSGKFFENGAHPSIVLNAPAKMDPSQITQLQTAFTNKYAGLANAHRLPLVLTEGVTAKELSLSAEDAQLLEARKFQVLDIARAFGVPGFMINESTGSTSWGSGIESIGRAFVQYTLQPWLIKIEQELNRKLYPRNTGRFLEFHREALYAGDIKAQAEYSRAALGGPGAGDGWMTINEVRRRDRMPPVDGGDILYRAPAKPGAEAPTNSPSTQGTTAQ